MFLCMYVCMSTEHYAIQSMRPFFVCMALSARPAQLMLVVVLIGVFVVDIVDSKHHVLALVVDVCMRRAVYKSASISVRIREVHCTTIPKKIP